MSTEPECGWKKSEWGKRKITKSDELYAAVSSNLPEQYDHGKQCQYYENSSKALYTSVHTK